MSKDMSDKSGKLKYIIFSFFCLSLSFSAKALTFDQIYQFQTQGKVLGATTNGLVGYWNFDEGSGTVANDTSGNGNAGTLIGGPTWTSGKIGSGALSFDGTSNYVNAGTNSNLDLTNNLTISVWVKLSDTPNAFGTVVSRADGGVGLMTPENGYAIWTRIISGNLWYYFEVSGQTGSLSNFVWNTGAAPDTNWHHIVGTTNGTTHKLYVDGIERKSSIVDTGPRTVSAVFKIGDDSNGGDKFKGTIDDLLVYNRALSFAEITELYNLGGIVNSGGGNPQSPVNGLCGVTVNLCSAGTFSDSADSSTNYLWQCLGSNGESTDSCTVVIPQNSATTNTYWVSPTGIATWTNCKSDTPLNGASACPLATANANAKAGDTVYLRDGVYLLTAQGQTGISPVNSGASAGNSIIFAAYSGETPIIKGSGCYDCGWGIYLNHSNKYIKIDGITFLNLGRWGTLTNYASYNEVTNSTFKSETGEDVVSGFFIGSRCNGGLSITCYSTHNWIHNNIFSKAHRSQNDALSCYEGRDLFRIGDPPTAGSTGADNYNTVENNYMEYAGHALFDSYGMYTVFRNNILHNEAWIPDTSGGTCWYPPMPNGMYGHRLMQISEDYGRDGLYDLIENNRMGHSSANPNNPGEADFAIAAPKNIVRYNYIYNSQQAGIFFKYDSYGRVGAGGTGSTNNRVYNNTIYHNGWTYPYMQQYQNSYNGHTCSTCPGKLAGITIGSGTLENVIKNNLVYDNFSNYLKLPSLYPGTLYTGLDITVDSGKNPINYPAIATVLNNWTTANGNPEFINPDVSNPSSKNLPDLSLQSSSPVINQGSYLATTTTVGVNSIILKVSDALYFQDGSWGSNLTHGVTFFPDWVAIGAVNNVAQIQSIDYSTNIITLKSPISWSLGDPVYLYKDSSGKQVLYGSAPDMGAYEYAGTIVTPPVTTYTPGDFNHDGAVNSLDYSLLNSNWFKTSNISLYDLQVDGLINSFDFAILKSNWGR